MSCWKWNCEWNFTAKKELYTAAGAYPHLCCEPGTTVFADLISAKTCWSKIWLVTHALANVEVKDGVEEGNTHTPLNLALHSHSSPSPWPWPSPLDYALSLIWFVACTYSVVVNMSCMCIFLSITLYINKHLQLWWLCLMKQQPSQYGASTAMLHQTSFWNGSPFCT